jgi:hypothetical protein
MVKKEETKKSFPFISPLSGISSNIRDILGGANNAAKNST